MRRHIAGCWDPGRVDSVTRDGAQPCIRTLRDLYGDDEASLMADTLDESVRCAHMRIFGTIITLPHHIRIITALYSCMSYTGPSHPQLVGILKITDEWAPTFT